MTKLLLMLLIAAYPRTGTSQRPPDSLIQIVDSFQVRTENVDFHLNHMEPSAYNSVTRLRGKDYFNLLGSSIKQNFTKPFHMTRKDWETVGKFAIVIVGVSLADQPIQQAALKFRNNSIGVQHVGNYISRFGDIYEIFTLSAFGLYGLASHNHKVKTVMLLASQAYISGGLIAVALKKIAGRTRPNYYGPSAKAEPRFMGPFSKSPGATGRRSNTSFPSGHTTLAFGAATVFAEEYASQPAIPIVAYTAATLIGISRITENKHWATDVLAGAALGYLTGKRIVNNYHRLANRKSQSKKSAGLSFNLKYEFGKVMPGVVYKF